MGGHFDAAIIRIGRWRHGWIDMGVRYSFRWIRTRVCQRGRDGFDGPNRGRTVPLGIGIRTSQRPEISQLYHGLALRYWVAVCHCINLLSRRNHHPGPHSPQ
ncbi:hypothetical protein VTN02DRAFT_3229 [Thermoascus thermophilus]